MARIKTVDLSNTTGAYHAPAAISPAGKLIHISGQVGAAKDGSVPADYESQIHLALLNLRKVIAAAGASVSDIVKLQLFIVNYNPARRLHTRHIMKFLRGHRPAITLVPVDQLAIAGWLFEVDATVSLPEPKLAPVLPAAMESYDVAIIGAGLAGLSAAHELVKAGVSCVVLEARDRVGGKTWGKPLASGKGDVDLGASWINDTNQSKMIALARRYGAELLEQNSNGNVVLQDLDGRCSPFVYGEVPNFDEATRKNIAEIRDMAEADCQALDTWSPRNTELDSMTFEHYIHTRGASPGALLTATVWTRAMLGQDPKDISALFFLNYCKSGGGLLQMRSDRKHGGQYLRIRQGTQLIAKGLAASLPAGMVRLESPVQAVVQENGRDVKVQAAGTVYSVRKVITTVPGPVLSTINFSPALPIAKQVWAESLTYGYYTKAMMEFKTPFWVKKGFCGLVNSFTGPASVIRDTSSPPDDKHVLTCFMAADQGRAWASAKTDEEKSAALLKQFSDLWEVELEELKKQFVSLNYYEWVNDEWAGNGCPCTALPPGVLDTLGPDALREQAGAVHFAGTETAGEWKGYMEGAVRSGERAAAEVVKDLNAGVKSRL